MSNLHAGFNAGRLTLLAVTILGASGVEADAVTDASAWAADIASRAPPTPVAVRAMAITEVSVFEAVNAITGRFPEHRAGVHSAPGASVDAAVAAATRTTLLALVPAEQARIEANYRAAIESLPDDPAQADGIAAGEQAASAVLAERQDDRAIAADTYRPHTTPGVYVPTVLPALPHWGQRKPWAMTRGDQFRPSPPPSLGSETWARDYNEIKALGAKHSTVRTVEQTAIARFWETTSPAVYWPVVRSVAATPGRDVTDQARLLAVAAMAMDDALIAVFDAKYAYNLWRPITAIRNGDLDGNDATERDPSWTPLIDTPLHPEYPCAHCIVSAALGAVLEAALGDAPMPVLSTSSPTAPGVVRRWTSVEDFVQEVAEARIYDGVHFRNSTEAGIAMGRQVGQLAAGKARLP